MPTRPIADGLFTIDPAPRLIGGQHRVLGRIVFPMPQGAEAALYEPVALAAEGTLWSWTIQRFRPKSPPYTGPADFAPFALGYVELPEQTIVQSRITGIAFDALRLGLPLMLTTIPFTTAPDGTEIITYAFGPAA